MRLFQSITTLAPAAFTCWISCLISSFVCTLSGCGTTGCNTYPQQPYPAGSYPVGTYPGGYPTGYPGAYNTPTIPGAPTAGYPPNYGTPLNTIPNGAPTLPAPPINAPVQQSPVYAPQAGYPYGAGAYQQPGGYYPNNTGAPVLFGR